jgi:hypothetical protein
MSITHSAKFLRTVLLIDAATCLATGLLMTLGADIVAGLTAIPAPLGRHHRQRLMRGGHKPPQAQGSRAYPPGL